MIKIMLGHLGGYIRHRDGDRHRYAGSSRTVPTYKWNTYFYKHQAVYPVNPPYRVVILDIRVHSLLYRVTFHHLRVSESSF